MSRRNMFSEYSFLYLEGFAYIDSVHAGKNTFLAFRR